MKVKRDTLLLLACLVWGAAGFNILRIGLAAYPAFRTALNFCLSALVFALFQRFVFGPLVKKHTARIRAYREELVELLEQVHPYQPPEEDQGMGTRPEELQL